MRPYVAVVGPGQAGEHELEAATEVGQGLARAGAVIITGGLGGVMAAACRGARQAGGMTVGLLPGSERTAVNEWVEVALPTGMGELRNGLLIRAADAVIAIGGAYGTLSEVALALKTQVPVIGLDSWSIAGVHEATDASAAVRAALEAAGAPPS